jgi:hypothetical protein
MVWPDGVGRSGTTVARTTDVDARVRVPPMRAGQPMQGPVPTAWVSPIDRPTCGATSLAASA